MCNAYAPCLMIRPYRPLDMRLLFFLSTNVESVATQKNVLACDIMSLVRTYKKKMVVCLCWTRTQMCVISREKCM